MAYADQSMSGNRVTALIVVALIHVVVGYALVTGLAFEAAKKVIQKVSTVDIKEEVKKEEPPPPPKKVDLPPPPVAPPVKINVAPAPPQITTTVTPPPAPPPIVLAPPAPAPPPPPSKAKGVTPKGQGSWAARIQENYPPRALREEREGRVGVRVTVGPDGRVSSCSVTSSSGSSDLDQAACDGMQRYARFNPAVDSAGNPMSDSWSTAIVYRLQ
jgi:protein TonB